MYKLYIYQESVNKIDIIKANYSLLIQFTPLVMLDVQLKGWVDKTAVQKIFLAVNIISTDSFPTIPATDYNLLYSFIVSKMSS